MNLFKLFGVVNHLQYIGYRFVKYLLLFLFISNCSVISAQYNENTFKKIFIEIDEEQIFDVNAITQDHQGYMWMATNLGLIRYNGLEGKKYNNKVIDSTSFEFYDITSLFVDHQGDMWIGAAYGLSKYNPECDCIQPFLSINVDISLTDIQSITEDKNKNVWIGTQGGGLFLYNRESDSFTRFFHKPSDSINVVNDNIEHLLVDQNNNLWIGTNSGLIHFNISTGNVKRYSNDPTNPNSLLDNRISALYEDQQGRILIGTYKCGFHIYDPKSESLLRTNYDENNPNQLHAPYTEDNVYGKDPFVKLIHQDQNGGYWISTTGRGINYFNVTIKKTRNYSLNLINPQLLWSFFEDRQGNIWIGGILGSGLFRMDPFARKYKLNTNFTNVEAAYESPLSPGTLWIKSRQGGLSKMNLETSKITKYVHDKENIKSIGHNWVRSVYQENKDILWVGLGNGGVEGQGTGNGGVDRMDIESGTFTHFKLTRSDDNRNDFSYTVYHIYEDNEGHLWLSTGTGGLFRSDKDKKNFKHFKHLINDTISTDYIMNIVRIDSNGDIWASDFSGQGTLFLFNHKENKFNLFLKGFKATNILIDEQGWLLISTWEKGLLHLNPADGDYVQYTKKDGLPSNEALDLVEGNKGSFWISTRMGPARFDSETGKISSIGLPKGRYNYGIFKTIDGQIYLGANNGLASFYPHQVIGNPYPPQISISDLLISDKNYLTGNNHSDILSLSYDQNDITFKYIGIHFSNPEKNSYQYRLNPLDDNWINAGFERTVRYANLPPGSYKFQVKAANSDGVWSDETDSVQFTIKPSWWTTWWAYAIYVIMAVFLADRFYRFQLSKRLAVAESARLKELDQVRNSLYSNVTHEFRTPLTVILGMADALKSTIIDKQLKGAEHSLELIKRNGNILMRLVNEMLDLSKVESGNMKLQLIQADVIPFVKYLSESFHSLAQEKQINLVVYSEIDELFMDFDANKLSVIISNILSNAIKFTQPGGKVIVHLKQIYNNKQKFFFTKIKDNGVGISEEEAKNIFNRFYQVDNSSSRQSEGTGIGLALTKEFVKLMNGLIEVKSSFGKGSEFLIQLPISNSAILTKNAPIHLEPNLTASATGGKLGEVVSEDNSELPLVLIIEDNTDVAHYLKTCLKEKYQIVHALNGAIGIEIAHEKIPDIIISDVMMPEKDGFEVCESLKTNELTDHIPIIMLTAKATFKDRLTGLSHGADAYLTKPFEKAELLTRIDQLILLRKKMLSKFEKTGIERLLNENIKNSETKFLHKIITVIHDNLTKSDFGSVQLALEMHLSESQLYRKLKAVSSKSTALFIRSIRLQKGKELIQTTNKTISEIAYDVGFNDPSWFSRAFKDEFGSAPILYRN